MSVRVYDSMCPVCGRMSMLHGQCRDCIGKPTQIEEDEADAPDPEATDTYDPGARAESERVDPEPGGVDECTGTDEGRHLR